MLALVVWGVWQCSSGFRIASQHPNPPSGNFTRNSMLVTTRRFAARLPRASAARAPTVTQSGFSRVHEKLGNAGAAQRGMINVNANTSGTFVTVQYSTSFALGPAQETFTWIKSGSTLRLYRYNVQSDAVFTK